MKDKKPIEDFQNIREKPPMKKYKKILIITASALALISATAILFFTLIFTTGIPVTFHNMKYYDTVRVENEFMPSLDELGDYKDIDMTCFKRISAFSSESCTLKVKYKSKIYEQEKENLSRKYSASYFPAISSSSSGDNTIEKDGYTISYIDRGNFPKQIFLIATNDDKKTVKYICFNDPDLDYIESFDDFLKKECRW